MRLDRDRRHVQLVDHVPRQRQCGADQHAGHDVGHQHRAHHVAARGSPRQQRRHDEVGAGNCTRPGFSK